MTGQPLLRGVGYGLAFVLPFWIIVIHAALTGNVAVLLGLLLGLLLGAMLGTGAGKLRSKLDRERHD